MADLAVAFDWIGALLLCGTIGVIALTHREMRAARLLLLSGCAVVTMRWTLWSFSTDAAWPTRAAIGAAFGALLLACAPALWRWSTEKERIALVGTGPIHAEPTEPPLGIVTLKQVFDADFLNSWGPNGDFPFTDSVTNKVTAIPIRMLLDSEALTRFFAIFLPKTSNEAGFAMYFVSHSEELINKFDSTIKLGGQNAGDPDMVTSDKYTFSRIIYFYTENELSYRQRADIQDLAASHNISVNFRGSAWATISVTNAMVATRIRNMAKNSKGHQAASPQAPTQPTPPEKK